MLLVKFTEPHDVADLFRFFQLQGLVFFFVTSKPSGLAGADSLCSLPAVCERRRITAIVDHDDAKNSCRL